MQRRKKQDADNSPSLLLLQHPELHEKWKRKAQQEQELMLLKKQKKKRKKKKQKRPFPATATAASTLLLTAVSYGNEEEEEVNEDSSGSESSSYDLESAYSPYSDYPQTTAATCGDTRRYSKHKYRKNKYKKQKQRQKQTEYTSFPNTRQSKHHRAAAGRGTCDTESGTDSDDTADDYDSDVEYASGHSLLPPNNNNHNYIR